jgi:hypothetical protein
MSTELSRQLSNFRAKNSLPTQPSYTAGHSKAAPSSFLLDPKTAALSEEEVVRAGQGAYEALCQEHPALEQYLAFIYPQGTSTTASLITVKPKKRDFLTEREVKRQDQGLVEFLTRLSPLLMEPPAQAVFEVRTATFLWVLVILEFFPIFQLGSLGSIIFSALGEVVRGSPALVPRRAPSVAALPRHLELCPTAADHAHLVLGGRGVALFSPSPQPRQARDKKTSGISLLKAEVRILQ